MTVKSNFVCVKVTDTIFCSISSVCIVFIVYAYRYIYSETRRQQKRLETEQLSHEEAKRLKKANKAAYTVTYILGALVLSYLPSIIIAVVTANIVDITSSVMLVMNILLSWSMTIISLNSLFNPIIYCWRIKKLRQAFLEIVHLRQPENSPPAIEMQAIPRHRPRIPPTSSEAFSAAMTVANQEPALLSFSHLQAEEIVHFR